MQHQKRSTRRNNSLAIAARPVLEALEQRQLLSVSLDHGVLSIVGSDGPDKVTVQPLAGEAGQLEVSLNGEKTVVKRDRVKRIEMSLGDGRDWATIESMGARIDVPVFIEGGRGNDTLAGAFGNDTIHGGGGNDLLSGRDGDDILVGGSGDDQVIGGNGDDLLIGGAGDDQISTGSPAGVGNDTVRGGAGSDSVNDEANPNFPIGTYTGIPAGYSPDQIRRAYGLGELSDRSFKNRGKGQAVAVIIAYHHPTALQDLRTFSEEYGLPKPNKKNFKVIRTTKRILTDEGWSGEAMMDIQWVHAMAPEAQILLVEAGTGGTGDIAVAIDKASKLLNKYYGGGVISMSLSFSGMSEFPGQAVFDRTFNNKYTKKITFVASAGDLPVPAYPGSSPHAVSIGGTTLNLDAYGNRVGGGNTSETPWLLGGSGPSAYFTQPLYQRTRGVPGTMRGTPDVALIADPATGASVYNSFGSGGVSGWATFGGTSLGAPIFAGMLALANQLRAQSNLPKLGNTALDRIYRLGGRGASAYFNDLTVGATGSYPAAAGWDFASGWGSPNAHTLLPALAEQYVPFVNKKIEFGGQLTSYDPTLAMQPGSNALQNIQLKGTGLLQGSGTLNMSMNTLRVFGAAPGTPTTLTLFGFDQAGVAAAGNPIILQRYGNTLIGLGQFEVAYGNQQGGGGGGGGTTTSFRGDIKFQATINSKGSVSGEIYTILPNGQRFPGIFYKDPANPNAVNRVFKGKFGT